ncbi:hypothetical protein [Paenibacillus sp. GXUN7292]|uniref:hypothetical protein n=1 Tax=Paenibacillus sp. GXUN7292 TaxID=3422499 RepID=UPI003D7ED724
MYWVKRVRRELMAYSSLQLRRTELLERLRTMDEGITPRISKLDDMPRAKSGRPNSTVEFMAVKREEDRQVIEWELKVTERLLDPIERGLKVLSDLEREVINLVYFNFDVPEHEIANSLGLSQVQFEDIKLNALSILDVHLMKPKRTELYNRYG